MAKGANATIAISQQTLDQRAEFSGDGESKKGVGTSQSILANIFPDSPVSSVPAEIMYKGEASGDGSSIQSDASDIYEVYANVVDPIGATSGFGFEGTEKAFLNYKHDNNPFVDGETIDFNSLTKGTQATKEDTSSSKRRYLGFPDLKAGSLDSPADSEGAESPAERSRQPTNNFGTTVIDDRKANSNSATNLLGRYRKSNQTDKDTVGKYFKANY